MPTIRLSHHNTVVQPPPMWVHSGWHLTSTLFGHAIKGGIDFDFDPAGLVRSVHIAVLHATHRTS